MKKLAKIVAILTALSVTMTIVAGCAAQTSTVETQEPRAAVGLHGSPDETFYMIQFLSGAEYWWPVYAGFKQAGALLGVQTTYVECPEYDAQAQLDVFEQVLARNPTGIMIAPIFPDIFVEPINRAIDQGVAVITFGTDSPESNRSAFITSDNVFEGQFAARQLAEEVGGVGKFMTLRNPGQLNHDIRVDVFRQTIEEEFPGIVLVDDVPTNMDVEAAYNAVMTVAAMHPDLNGVFMPDAQNGMGAARASVELGGNIRVLCVDTSETVLDMIQAGEIWGTLNPDQGMQGFWGMMLLFVSANPDLIEPMNHRKSFGLNPVFIPFMDNGLNVVTAENAAYFYIDAYIERLGYNSLAELLAPHVP